MSDVEVVDSVDPVVDAGVCFGEYDESYKECLKQCQLRTKCKEQTKLAPKPVQSVEDAGAGLVEEVEQFQDMDPFDFLVKTLEGKYDVSRKMDGAVTVVNCKKGGKAFAQIRRTEAGRYLIRIPAQGDLAQIGAIGTVQKALAVYKAILAG